MNVKSKGTTNIFCGAFFDKQLFIFHLLNLRSR